MANFGDKITVVVDVVTEKAKTGLKSFRDEVGKAEGFTGKLKAGVGSLSGAFSSAVSSPAALGGAVATAGAFAFEAAGKFSELGVEVGKFSDATGLSTQDASRLIEVSADLGVSADSVATAINKMNKTIDPDLFDRLGVSIARTKDGTVDANETFLNVIDRLHGIQDPAERARVATQLLGKGWQDMAEMIGQSGAKLRESLAGVSDAKVMTPEEVAQAKKFRDSMNDLKDSLEDLVITIGEKVAPMLADTAENLSGAGGTADLLAYSLQKGLEPVNLFTGAGRNLQQAWDGVYDLFSDDTPKRVMEDWRVGGDRAREMAGKVDDLAGSTKSYLAQAHKVLKVEEDIEQNRRDLIGATLDLEQAQIDVTKALEDAKKAQEDDKASLDEKKQATLDAKQQVHDYIDELGNIPAEQETLILASIDAGKYAEVGNMLAMLTAARQVQIVPVVPVGGANVPLTGQNSPSGQAVPGVGTRAADLNINLNLNDRSLQTITVRQADLNRGSR